MTGCIHVSVHNSDLQGKYTSTVVRVCNDSMRSQLGKMNYDSMYDMHIQRAKSTHIVLFKVERNCAVEMHPRLFQIRVAGLLYASLESFPISSNWNDIHNGFDKTPFSALPLARNLHKVEISVGKYGDTAALPS